MDNILSIVTFIPAIAAGILALFLHGEDDAANRKAKLEELKAKLDDLSDILEDYKLEISSRSED